MAQIITNNGGGGGVGLYKYKGSVDYYGDLPSSGMKVGDVYNVVNAFSKDGKDYPAGTNVAWTGTDWDPLGGSIDLSDYQKKLVEGSGIDINQTTNEISVESTVISGAALGATSVQPGDDVSDLNNDAGYITSADIPTNVSAFNNDAGYIDKDVNNLTHYTLSCDLSTVATSGEYCDLSGRPTIGDGKLTICVNGLCKNEFTANQTANVGVDIGVPTCTSQLSNDSGFIDNTVSDLCNYTLSSNLCAVATSGKYCDLSGRVTDNCQIANSCGYITSSALSPYAKCCDIPTDNCQLTNGCGYTTCTGTLVASDIANLAQCCDIPTDNCQLLNGCGYTTCTGTVVASDLTPYAKSCDLCTVATSGKYCDLTGTPALCTVATSGLYCDLTGLPTIPTDNCQLANSCGYTTCIGTVVAADLTPYAKSADLCAVATSGLYCDLSGTPTIPTDNCQLANGCGYAKASTLCTVATSGKYCDLTGTPTIGSGTLTIQKNGTCVDTFSANATANKTINITVPTDNCQLGNSCGYTTCTGTLVASDLTPYAKSCDLCTVATTGKYCDLTGTPTIPTVIDNLCSSCTTEALSAKQGCVLNARLDTVEARGRFLSNWNATTGQPVSFPEAIPYTYSTGDYYDVTVVGATNYRPNGSSYTGAASTTVETGDLEIGDTYVYDGTNWLLQQNHNITTSFSSISGSPYDNTCLASALGDKANTSSLCAVATSGKYCDLTGTPTIPTDNCQLANSCGYITSSALSGYQLTCNMVCNLSGADNTHYPTAKAVADALSCAGQGDMLKSVYDPCNKNADAFDYTNFINTPVLCTVATSGKYCDLTGTPSLCAVATSGQYCDLTGQPTKLSCFTNDCGYTTCTGTLVASDLTPYAKSCDVIKCKSTTGSQTVCTTASGCTTAFGVKSAATSSYISLNNCSGWLASIGATNDKKPAWYNGSSHTLAYTTDIPTDNCQLANSCGYTTCTGTVVASDLTPYALSSSLCAVATTGKYCDLTGTPAIPAAQIQSDWTQTCNTCKDYIKNKPSLCTVATSGKYCDLTGTPTIPTNNNQLTNGCGYTTCTGTLVASDLTPYAKTCDLKTVATSGKYCDLTGTPTIGTATLTIQKNGVQVQTFGANATSNVTANITVPTNTCELTNGAGFITGISSSDVTTALGYTPYSSANPSGYTTCTGTLTQSAISDAAFSSSWNGDTTHAASKNAIYDVLGDVETLLANL